MSDLHESIFFSLSFWRAEDYLAHWDWAARQCLKPRSPVTFVTDLSPKLVGAFIGFAADGAVDFEDWLIPRKELSIEGCAVRFRAPDQVAREPGAASWRVPLDGIRKTVAVRWRAR